MAVGVDVTDTDGDDEDVVVVFLPMSVARHPLAAIAATAVEQTTMSWFMDKALNSMG